MASNVKSKCCDIREGEVSLRDIQEARGIEKIKKCLTAKDKENPLRELEEAIGRNTNISEIMEKCLFLKATGGGRSRVSKKLATKAGLELLRKDGKDYVANVRGKITKLMELHDATPQDIEAVYNHIIMELLD